MNRLIPLPLLFLLLGLLAGCTSYETQVDPGHAHAGLRRIFVLTNPNDGHAVDHQIAAALISRGYQADSGPLTMMPEETEAIVSYQDHWTWDFGDHLVYLQIVVGDRKSSSPFARVAFSAKVPTHRQTTDIVDDLVGRLLPGKS